MKAGAVTCPLCGFTTQKAHVRSQLKARDGGARDARLMCVVETSSKAPGKFYRLPTDAEVAAVKRACGDLASWTRKRLGGLPAIPDEPLPQQRIWKNNPIRVHLYGKITWGDLFSPRQQLALASLAWELRDAAERARRELEGPLGRAVALGLCLVLDKMADSNSVQVWWMASGQKTVGTFTRQALSFIGDFAEIPISEGPSRSITESAEWICRVVENLDAMGLAAGGARAHRADAAALPMPDDAADAVITDPPYYDAVPYGTLSDFFYVWLKRVGAIPMDSAAVVEKKEECVMDEGVGKDGAFFERKMTDCLREARRVAKPEGVGVIVFAHKTTAGWEAMLSSLIEAGWVVTATWPIDTERVVKVNTINRAFLGSSVHIVCRPRETGDGSLRQGHIGDWREVCRELPQRIHSWMPRLAEEGVVGADAIFACLGPALEVFSVYSRVEKADGEPVKLREYLEQVWAAVSKEALSMIFRDPETAGLEPDARLTAMWLWTLAGPTEMDGSDCAGEPDEAEGEGEGEDDPKKREKVLGFPLEYDAARKIAQGLGATLENLTSVVEVKGDKARLLAVGERARSLFGKSEATVPGVVTRAGKKQQMRLFEEEIESVAEEEGWEAAGAPAAGKTALDRVHQAMLLFGTGRSEALKRFLMEGGAGRQAAFWKLAQALSALYPAECDEKRWVDGVLARKKGLGF